MARRSPSRAIGTIEDAEFGTDDRRFRLRAEIDGDGTTRTYSATYEAEDASGEVTTTAAEVVVLVQ